MDEMEDPERHEQSGSCFGTVDHIIHYVYNDDSDVPDSDTVFHNFSHLKLRKNPEAEFCMALIPVTRAFEAKYHTVR
jgi:hypothetical protein